MYLQTESELKTVSDLLDAKFEALGFKLRDGSFYDHTNRSSVVSFVTYAKERGYFRLIQEDAKYVSYVRLSASHRKRKAYIDLLQVNRESSNGIYTIMRVSEKKMKRKGEPDFTGEELKQVALAFSKYWSDLL